MGGRTESNFWTTYDSCGRDTVCGYGPHYGGTWIPFGFFVQHPIRGMLVFEPELLYSPKGSGEGSTPVVNLKYLEIPLLIRITPPRTDSSFTRPFFNVGPGVGYLLQCALTENGPFGASCSSPQNSENRRKPWELSSVIGVGLEHRFADGTLIGVEARFARSLTNTGTVPGATTINSATMYLLRWRP
jgi:hypothetical protein